SSTSATTRSTSTPSSSGSLEKAERNTRMRTSDVDILLVPGWTGSGPDHWQSRWARSLRTARIVEQEDWDRPDREKWVERIVAAVRAATRPVILVAHSCGVAAVAHAAPMLPRSGIAGAYLVAPADLEGTDTWPATE